MGIKSNYYTAASYTCNKSGDAVHTVADAGQAIVDKTRDLGDFLHKKGEEFGLKAINQKAMDKQMANMIALGLAKAPEETSPQEGVRGSESQDQGKGSDYEDQVLHLVNK